VPELSRYVPGFLLIASTGATSSRFGHITGSAQNPGFCSREQIQDDEARDATRPAKGFLVQLSPDPCAGTEDQKSHGFSAVPQVSTNSRVRRYLPVFGSRTMGPVP